IGSIWVGAVERWQSPMLHIATDNPDDKETAKANADTIGSQAVLVTGLDSTKITPIVGMPTKDSPAESFEQRCQRRAAIAILGAEQTVSVSQGDGSQQSVDAQANIREDFLFADLEGFF